MDYDKGQRLYHIPVRASDRGAPYRRETEKIFAVTIENVNDNSPMFEYDKCDVQLAKVSKTVLSLINMSSKISRYTACVYTIKVIAYGLVQRFLS